MTIFGISLGTTQTGVCILKDGLLINQQVHNFHETWSQEKLTKITNRYREYIEVYNPSAIVVKVPPSINHKGAVKSLMNKIALLAKEYHSDLDFITKDELKDKTGTKTTEELIEWTRRLYPDLTALYEKGASNDHRYYKKLFEAVLSAHVYQNMKRLRGANTTE
jgi:RNase H-fold protein (predicted Holliday junction resolvase)